MTDISTNHRNFQMATPIYSRYIPPKKTKALQAPEVELEPPVSEVAAVPPPTSTPSIYARYIPPKTKSQEISSIEHPAPAKISLPKRKREDVIEVQTEIVAKKQKKEKREKREKKIKKQDTEEQLPSQPETTEKKDDSKHKAILNKRDKSLRKAEKQAKKTAELAEEEEDAPDEDIPVIEELHDLVPLPQPEPVPELPIQSSTSSLPLWLASPIRVSPTDVASFKDVGVHADAARVLEGKGFKGAFAVQAAVLPLLLPGKSQQQGDILVSAATGSGKTLAYVLPMIENISQHTVTRLRGVIVMPTRELVAQAREICEVCATAFSKGSRKRAKIGTAVGSENFKIEQASIMEQEDRYDPAGRKDQERRLNRKWESSDWGSDDDGDGILCDDEPISRLPDHVISHVSKIDILICTPGRLVEHIKNTPGLTMQYIKWLVVDEADKLLDQTFQNWLSIVMGALENARLLYPTNSNRVRKCILSATLTKDVGQLSGLKLYRPKLVVLEGTSSQNEGSAVTNSESGHALPGLLVEKAVKSDEDSLKPLYLMELLTNQGIVNSKTNDIVSDSDSDNSSSDESSGAESSSSPKAEVSKKSLTIRGVLIFTKSNETAVRLGRLIALLEPEYSGLIGTLTSTTRSSARKSTIKSFNSCKLAILVASDLVSRGLDLPNLAHVINYDVPTSVTNYVHRVGRTARAGKTGSAWTIFTGAEGAWFWNGIARSKEIQRENGSQVARINIKAESFDEGLRSKYEAALEELGREASASSKPKKSNKDK